MLKKLFVRSTSERVDGAHIADRSTSRTFWSVFLPSLATYGVMLMATTELANGNPMGPHTDDWFTQHLLTTPLTLVAWGRNAPHTVNYLTGLLLHVAAWTCVVMVLRSAWMANGLTLLRSMAPARAEVEAPQPLAPAAPQAA